MSDRDFGRDRFPWLRSGFDLEGYAGAFACLMVGFLLSVIVWQLFLIGLAGAVIVLLATRTAERTPPEAGDLIVAPTDGIVVSVSGARPPDELRLEGAEWTRVRVSIGPTKTNGVYAPMDGAIDHIIRETGDPAAFAATKPDRPGLAVAYVSFESGDRAIGMRLATGGLGPRLEVASESGDAVRLGRNIGTLRMGGWCDIYVPAGIDIVPSPGQTLIGSETVLGQFGGFATKTTEPEAASETPPPADPEPEAEPVEGELVIEDEDELTLEALTGDPETPKAEEEDVSEMFARLRKEAQKIQDGDT